MPPLVFDIAKLGSGIWYTLHKTASLAKTPQEKDVFISNVKNLAETFGCTKCRIHFQEFIETHPFNKYWSIKDTQGRDIGMFQWTWELHNAVNKRIGKPVIPFDTAYKYYTTMEAEVCSECAIPVNSEQEKDITIADSQVSNVVSQVSSQGDVTPVLKMLHLYRNGIVKPKNL